MKRYFATCARGLEPFLANELRLLGAVHVEPGRGGVGFQGDRAILYKANLWLRTAIRVLQPILEADVFSADELYQAVQTVDWSKYLTIHHTLAVDCNVRDSTITHSLYAALKTKDAICDQFLAKYRRRPSVDTEKPMVGLNLHIYRNHMILSLDSSWNSLHKRGYRPILTRAPLNEALAAGLIYQTGWDGSAPLLDPMCGSGTLPIEAAWIVLQRPPGLTRSHFGFQGWLDFQIEEWTELRDQARRLVRKTLPMPILGSDIRRDAVEFSHTNARAAGVGHLLRFRLADIRDVRPPENVPPGVLIANPPYGERIGDVSQLRALYQAIGDSFAWYFRGWRCFLFSSNAQLLQYVDLPIVRLTPFFNGKLECQLVEYHPT